MKVKVYMRVAEGGRGPIVDASTEPNYAPLCKYDKTPYPTAAFALDIEVPDEMMRRAEQTLAEINVMEHGIDIATEVVYP